MIIESKKHAFSNIVYFILFTLFGVLAILLTLEFLFKSDNDSDLAIYKGVILFCSFIVCFGIRKVVLNKKVSWVLRDNCLTIKGGFLPWKQSHYDIDISQIFEASYFKSPLGSMIGYGKLCLQRTDGSVFYESTMTNHKLLMSEVNNRIHEYRNPKSTTSVNRSEQPKSVVYELKELAELNKSGVLSNSEFEKLKQKLIN